MGLKQALVESVADLDGAGGPRESAADLSGEDGLSDVFGWSRWFTERFRRFLLISAVENLKAFGMIPCTP